jgi:hypothetical protein
MRHLSAAVVFSCLSIAAPVAAQQQNLRLFPTFTLGAGGYLGDFGTKLRVDPHIEGLQGTTIDLEKNLGLSSSRKLSRFEMSWRPFRRHELEFSYYRTRRVGDRVIDRQIVYEDTTFPIQANIHSEFNVDFVQANYTYWMRQTYNSGLGVTLGVTGLKFNGRLHASVANTSATFDQDAATNFPVPEIGLDGRLQLTNNVIGSARAAVLPKVSIKDYKGEVYLARAALEYRALRNVSIGAGYNYMKINGQAEKTNFHADLGMTISGWEGFLKLVF